MMMVLIKYRINDTEVDITGSGDWSENIDDTEEIVEDSSMGVRMGHSRQLIKVYRSLGTQLLKRK